MARGTSKEAALSIVQGGFGTVSLLDAGWYGQGIYFTVCNMSSAKYLPALQNSIEYACKYDKSADTKTLILALVTPGNVYPVRATCYLQRLILNFKGNRTPKKQRSAG